MHGRLRRLPLSPRLPGPLVAEALGCFFDLRALGMITAIHARAGVCPRFPEIPATIRGVVRRPRLHAYYYSFIGGTRDACLVERPFLGDWAGERAFGVDAPAEPFVTALRLVPEHFVAAAGARAQVHAALELLPTCKLHALPFNSTFINKHHDIGEISKSP